MPLKPKNPQTQSESINRKDETEGPWGRINPGSRPITALRFCKKISTSSEETYSYPYRVLSFWHWCGGAMEEELKIEIGCDFITVKGRGLDRLVEALDHGVLEMLCEIEGEVPAGNGAIWISTITISDTRN